MSDYCRQSDVGKLIPLEGIIGNNPNGTWDIYASQLVVLKSAKPNKGYRFRNVYAGD